MAHDDLDTLLRDRGGLEGLARELGQPRRAAMLYEDANEPPKRVEPWRWLISRLRGRCGLLAALVSLSCMFLATPASTQSATLTPDLLNKLLDFNARKGIDRDVPAIFANALGFTSNGQSWPSRQVVPKPDSENPSLYHGFTVGQRTEQDVVFVVRYPDGNHAFRVRRNGMLVTAVYLNQSTNQLTEPNRAEAQKELDAEVVYWTRVVADDK
jgi:hypothetical protein